MGVMPDLVEMLESGEGADVSFLNCERCDGNGTETLRLIATNCYCEPRPATTGPCSLCVGESVYPQVIFETDEGSFKYTRVKSTSSFGKNNILKFKMGDAEGEAFMFVNGMVDFNCKVGEVEYKHIPAWGDYKIDNKKVESESFPSEVYGLMGEVEDMVRDLSECEIKREVRF